MYQESFHLKLRQARIDAGYTQQQTSEETGIARSTIANYERGRTQPDVETLGVLAQFYNVDLNWLFGISLQPVLHPHGFVKKTRKKEDI